MVELSFEWVHRSGRWLRRARRTAAALLLSLSAACGGSSTTGHFEPDESPLPTSRKQLRVVTFNTWLVPFRTGREAMVDRIAHAVAELDADVVGLQEVWAEQDARRLAEALRMHGYRWIHWRASTASLPIGSPGLMLASRLPFARARYTPYRAGKLPLVPWQPDWMSAKGFLSVDVLTSGGPIRVVTTHAQADYRSHGYDAVRLSQMVQLGRVVAQADVPVIVAGDLNVRRGERGHASLVDLAGVEELEDNYGVDAILFRGTDDRALRLVRSKRVLGSDDRGRLSDHHGVLAELAIREASAAPPATQGGGIGPRIARESLVNGRVAPLAGAMAVLAFLVARRLILARLRARRLRWIGLAMITVVGLWCVYVATVYGPARQRWLAAAATDASAAR